MAWLTSGSQCQCSWKHQLPTQNHNQFSSCKQCLLSSVYLQINVISQSPQNTTDCRRKIEYIKAKRYCNVHILKLTHIGLTKGLWDLNLYTIPTPGLSFLIKKQRYKEKERNIMRKRYCLTAKEKKDQYKKHLIHTSLNSCTLTFRVLGRNQSVNTQPTQDALF